MNPFIWIGTKLGPKHKSKTTSPIPHPSPRKASTFASFASAATTFTAKERCVKCPVYCRVCNGEFTFCMLHHPDMNINKYYCKRCTEMAKNQVKTKQHEIFLRHYTENEYLKDENPFADNLEGQDPFADDVYPLLEEEEGFAPTERRRTELAKSPARVMKERSGVTFGRAAGEIYRKNGPQI